MLVVLLSEGRVCVPGLAWSGLDGAVSALALLFGEDWAVAFDAPLLDVLLPGLVDGALFALAGRGLCRCGLGPGFCTAGSTLLCAAEVVVCCVGCEFSVPGTAGAVVCAFAAPARSAAITSVEAESLVMSSILLPTIKNALGSALFPASLRATSEEFR